MIEPKKLYYNFNIALNAILSNKLRSMLTALGIIFGVAAVIAMMSIGSGAQREILDQMKLVGVNNIVVTPVVEQLEEEVKSDFSLPTDNKFSPGLTLVDAKSIQQIVPNVEVVSPEIIQETFIIKNGIRRSTKLVGVTDDYFPLANFQFAAGKTFNREQIERGDPVCIIGKDVAIKFFRGEDPIGKKIKCGPHWLKVIGVLEKRIITESSINNLGLRDFNLDVYIPITSFLIRYENRALVTKTLIQQSLAESNKQENNVESIRDPNYHQLDRLTVRVSKTEQLSLIADVIARMLKRRHYDVVDFEVTIPELLLKQQQRTKSVFNFVLGAIAGISLLVGGIGIMNIMLASVLERIKEIGLRLAIGAKKTDIIVQFVLEAMMISISGGILGIILGISIAVFIAQLAEIPTIISFFSILISFGVAASIGLIFGITPAKRAANQDPITSLRYE